MNDRAPKERINVKACMLTNVLPSDALFATTADARIHSLSMMGETPEEQSTALALARFGSGTVSFVGDVNYEEDTINIMGTIAKGDPTLP